VKKLILAATLLFSMSSFANTYDCKIAKQDLPIDAEIDLEFQVNTQVPFMTVLGDTVEHCNLFSYNIVTCEDDEGMPYSAMIVSDTEIELTIGGFLSNTLAKCTKR
jgi:hypothetical protein